MKRAFNRVRTVARLTRKRLFATKVRSAALVVLVALPVSGIVGYSSAQESYLASTTFEKMVDRDLRGADLVTTYYDDIPITEDEVYGAPQYAEGAVVPITQPLDELIPQVERFVTVETASGPISSPDTSMVVSLQAADLNDPLTVGWRPLLDGRNPQADNEIALSWAVADGLGIGVGDEVRLPQSTQPYEVVGIVEHPELPRSDAFAILRSLPTGLPFTTSYRASLSGPVSWEDVRPLHSAGQTVVARNLAAEDAQNYTLAPSADADAVIAESERAYEASRTSDAYKDSAADTGFGGIGFFAAILVFLLASIGFSVTAKSVKRQSALLLASGATRGTIRSIAVLHGLVIGVIGSAMGAGIGIAGVYVFSKPVGRLFDHTIEPIWFDWVSIVVFTSLGIIGCTAAAALPAVAAARIPIAAALEERPTQARYRRWPVALVVPGAVLAGLTVWWLVDAARSNDYRMLLNASISLLIASWLFLPAVIAGITRLRRGPIALRLALRDHRRNLGRSVAAAAAVSLGATAFMAGSAVAYTNDFNNHESYLPAAFTNQIIFTLDSNGKTADELQSLINERTEQITAILPEAEVSQRANVAGSSCTTENTIACVDLVAVDEASTYPCRTDYSSGLEESLYRDSTPECSNKVNAFRVLAVDDADLASFFSNGDVPPGAQEAIDAGGAVVFDERIVNKDDSVRLSSLESAPVRLPTFATERTLRDAPGALISPATAEANGFVVQNTSQLTFTTPYIPTEEQADAVRAISAGQASNYVFFSPGYDYVRDTLDIVIPAVAAAFALIGALAVLGLTLAEQATLLATMGAVGATARYRRILAATSAGAIAFIGTLWGTGVGIVVAGGYLWTGRWLPALNGNDKHYAVDWVATFPWLPMAAVLVAVPLLSGVIAFFCTRSRSVVRHRR